MSMFFHSFTKDDLRYHAVISTHGNYSITEDSSNFRQAGPTEELGLVYVAEADALHTDPDELTKEDLENRLRSIAGAGAEERVASLVHASCTHLATEMYGAMKIKTLPVPSESELKTSVDAASSVEDLTRALRQLIWFGHRSNVQALIERGHRRSHWIDDKQAEIVAQLEACGADSALKSVLAVTDSLDRVFGLCFQLAYSYHALGMIMADVDTQRSRQLLLDAGQAIVDSEDEAGPRPQAADGMDDTDSDEFISALRSMGNEDKRDSTGSREPEDTCPACIREEAL